MTDSTTDDDRKSAYPNQVQSDTPRSNSLPPTEDYNHELFRIHASRFVDLFPDELVIQEKAVSIIHNELLVSYVETIPVKDIGRIVYVDALFFARIEVLGKNPAHDLYIKGLHKDQAIIAKNILDGLLLKEPGSVDAPEWLHADTRRDVLARSGSSDHRQSYRSK
jgi:hypothetical protein